MSRSRRSLVIAAVALVGLTVGGASPAFASAASSQDDVVAKVMGAPDPLGVLDSLSPAEGAAFLVALKQDPTILDANPEAFLPVVDAEYLDLDEGDASAPALKSKATVKSTAAVTAAAASRYNDLAWDAVEGASCVVDIADVVTCSQAKTDADAAAQAAVNEYPSGSQHNDRGDALRHCGWNMRMLFDFGGTTAYKIATNHENVRNSVAAEKKMDLYNNLQGRDYGRESTSKSKGQDKCVSASHSAKKDYSTPLVIL